MMKKTLAIVSIIMFFTAFGAAVSQTEGASPGSSASATIIRTYDSQFELVVMKIDDFISSFFKDDSSDASITIQYVPSENSTTIIERIIG